MSQHCAHPHTHTHAMSRIFTICSQNLTPELWHQYQGG